MARKKHEVTLGLTYKDKVSGFVGVAVQKSEYLNGCVRFALEPKVDKDGKTADTIPTFDVQQLELVDDTHILDEQPTLAAATGGTPSRSTNRERVAR